MRWVGYIARKMEMKGDTNFVEYLNVSDYVLVRLRRTWQNDVKMENTNIGHESED
jgi:hypothetical protein